jgi:hypothetical protein
LYRFGLIVFVLAAVLILVFRQLSRQGTTRRFRVVVLVLLGVLLVLAGLGLYSTWRQPQDLMPQTEFARDSDEILDRITKLLQDQDYTQAYKLAQRYKQVQDPRLEQLLNQAREQVLLSRIKALKPDRPMEVARLYQRLQELAPNKGYQALAQDWRQKASDQEAQALQQALKQIETDKYPLRWLVYRRLHELAPEDPGFAQQKEALDQRLSKHIEQSPWTSICSSSAIRYCRFKGFVAWDPVRQRRLGGILGVAWRPKGALISVDGQSTAPKDAYYYIVLPEHGELVLSKTGHTETRLPSGLRPWRQSLLPGDRFPVAR